jgi:hypothetical protein
LPSLGRGGGGGGGDKPEGQVKNMGGGRFERGKPEGKVTNMRGKEVRAIIEKERWRIWQGKRLERDKL